MSEERMRILEMVADGTITAEQAAQLIQALEETDETAEFAAALPAPENPMDPQNLNDSVDFMEMFAEADPRPAAPPARIAQPPSGQGAGVKTPAEMRRWKAFWFIPMGIGVFVTALSGLLLYAGIQGEWHWFWMSCVWLPLLAGILVILLAWMSRTARWVHVRVNTGQDEWPRRIAISLPLPLGAAAWFLRYFGRFIPGLDDVPIPIHEAIYALQKSLSPDDPIYVKVEDSGGERVEVYIG